MEVCLFEQHTQFVFKWARFKKMFICFGLFTLCFQRALKIYQLTTILLIPKSHTNLHILRLISLSSKDDIFAESFYNFRDNQLETIHGRITIGITLKCEFLVL